MLRPRLFVPLFALLLCPLSAMAAAPDVAPRVEERTLSFHHLHTGERLEVMYWRGGSYLPPGLEQADRLLRDHRDGTVHPMDPALLDLLFTLRAQLAPGGTFEVICGYRTPASNRRLASTTTGIGTRSLHMQGKAVDVRLTGVPLARLRDAALALKAGGVGYYPRSDFVHLDTGPVRRW